MFTKNKAFALAWIVLSALFCCVLFGYYIFLNQSAELLVHNDVITNSKLALFLSLIGLMSVGMGIFFFINSTDLNIFLGNYKRTKNI